MKRRTSYQTYAYRAVTVAAAYLVSLIAWLDNRGVISLTAQRFVGHSVEAWIGTASLVVTIPGWFIVTLVRSDQLATKLTDILIPILSGAVWGLLAILVAKLTKLLLRYTRATVPTPTQSQNDR